jgi:hypothetical protein
VSLECILCSCIECREWKAWMTWMVVVGGVFIALTTILAVGRVLYRSAHRTVWCAPDTSWFIVRCVPRQPTVRVWSSWPLKSSILVAHQIVWCYLTSQTVPDLWTHQTEVAVNSWRGRPLFVGSPDSPVTHRTGEERCVFPRASSSLGASAWAPDTVRCAAGWCKSVLLHTYRIAPRVISLICICELYAPEKRSTRQTS